MARLGVLTNLRTGKVRRVLVVVKCRKRERRFAARLLSRAVRGWERDRALGLEVDRVERRVWLLLVAASRKSGRCEV